MQILDPATGTGTFLAEVVKHIHKKFEGQQGSWSSYVEKQLLPRLNGFELLMASYAMAHLKLDMLLTETGYKPTSNQRFKIYLTNSLEEYHKDTGTLFANWLSTEANEANQIKRDTPVMVVMGNPPYSGESANQGEWIMKLMEDYKLEPGGKEKLKELNSKFINDDYVKFIRYGQYFIEKNETGILAFINPHGFLDNPTFRGMRWNLIKTFDKIYTIDLHGNTKKGLNDPDGNQDQNVFNIMQGVSINFFIKNGKKKSNDLGEIFHFDLYGKRDYKYRFLNENNFNQVPYQKIITRAPMYFMVQKDLILQEEYNKGVGINEIFQLNSLGVLTKKDKFIIDFDKENIITRLNDFISNEIPNELLAKKYDLKLQDNDKWNLSHSREKIQKVGIVNQKFKILNYRCFDERWIYYDGDFVARLNNKVFRHLEVDNVALISTRQLANDNFNHIFISKIISDQCFISNKTKEGCQVFPLYLYREQDDRNLLVETSSRTPNINQTFTQTISEKLNYVFLEDDNIHCDLAAGVDGTFSPINVLNYIYAVLHSPTYREKYKEFLKIDFPRIPYPKDSDTFTALDELGDALRKIHLLESPIIEKVITKYPEAGSNVVNKISFEVYDYIPSLPGDLVPDYLGVVKINDEQYFADVPKVAWDFYIGGYQPAQKWLKDRKGRELSFEDIRHYQKIIVALVETHRLMKEIDKINIE